MTGPLFSLDYDSEGGRFGPGTASSQRFRRGDSETPVFSAPEYEVGERKNTDASDAVFQQGVSSIISQGNATNSTVFNTELSQAGQLAGLTNRKAMLDAQEKLAASSGGSSNGLLGSAIGIGGSLLGGLFGGGGGRMAGSAFSKQGSTFSKA
jgi:hypothetical protein